MGRQREENVKRKSLYWDLLPFLNCTKYRNLKSSGQDFKGDVIKSTLTASKGIKRVSKQLDPANRMHLIN